MEIPPISRKVVMVIFDGVEILDVAGPASVFSKANAMIPGSYDFQVAGPCEGLAYSNSGMTIALQGSWKNMDPAGIDTVIVAGGHEEVVIQEMGRTELAAWLAAAAPAVRRVASVCTGAFALGQAGLLHGKSATTHWSACALLQGRFPEARVQSDRIYVQDGKVWTSAGILTGIDLALALVEEDLGRQCALAIGRLLVLAGMRPGESPQHSALLDSQAHVNHPLRDLLSWIQLNLTQDLSSETLAERLGLSERHFRRLFQDEVGQSPARYVAACRLDHAALLLRSTAWNVEWVARKSGFDSIDAMQRGFARRWGLSPGKYRERHADAGAPAA
jgi:transcriptional regulator GlxA family with amidase domain